MGVKVGWDISHQEFTITDYYYFSVLQRETEKHGIEVEEVDDWESLSRYDVIVLNYPEIPFTESEVKDVQRWVHRDGKRVILAGYYKNEDKIADTCNTLARAFGMELNSDEVRDEVSNHKGDGYFVVSSKVRRYNRDEKGRINVKKVMLACTASVKPLTPDVKAVVRGEESARSNMGFDPLLIAEHIDQNSGGYFCLAGTCVFWDNYSIELYDNANFSLNLLRHLPPSKGSKVVIG